MAVRWQSFGLVLGGMLSRSQVDRLLSADKSLVLSKWDKKVVFGLLGGDLE